MRGAWRWVLVGCDAGSVTIPEDTTDDADATADVHDPGEVFSVTTPADAAGGYLIVDITDVQGGRAMVKWYVDGDEDWIDISLAAFADTDLHAWVAAAPDTTYHYQIFAGSGGGSVFFELDTELAYRAETRFVPTPDAHEPNDRPAEATPADRNSMNGTFFAGYTQSGSSSDATADWFAFTREGPFTATIDDVAPDAQAILELFPADDPTESWEREQGERGGAARIDVDRPPTDRWLARVTAWLDEDAGAGDIPASAEAPYTLRIADR